MCKCFWVDWYFKELSISHRISISTGQSCVWSSKKVCIQSKRRGKNPELVSSRGGPAATRSQAEDITDPGGDTSLCFCSNQRGIPLQFPLIFASLWTSCLLCSVFWIFVFAICVELMEIGRDNDVDNTNDDRTLPIKLNIAEIVHLYLKFVCI